MRVHKINNVNKALDFIASKGVKLVSIGAEGKHGYMSHRLPNKYTLHQTHPSDVLKYNDIKNEMK